MLSYETFNIHKVLQQIIFTEQEVKKEENMTVTVNNVSLKSNRKVTNSKIFLPNKKKQKIEFMNEKYIWQNIEDV